jgi:plasmid stability protein
MKSISIHGIDKETEKLIRERAKTEGKSVNKVVKELIANALGLGDKKKKIKDKREEYADLCGVWTEKEATQFLESIADMETIDERDWQ